MPDPVYSELPKPYPVQHGQNPNTGKTTLLKMTVGPCALLPEFLEQVPELLLVVGSEELILVTGHQVGQGQAFLVLP
jgi:hypothetical protein